MTETVFHVSACAEIVPPSQKPDGPLFHSMSPEVRVKSEEPMENEPQTVDDAFKVLHLPPVQNQINMGNVNGQLIPILPHFFAPQPLFILPQFFNPTMLPYFPILDPLKWGLREDEETATEYSGTPSRASEARFSELGDGKCGPCVVCNDLPTRQHYGVECCAGCAAFFRRKVRGREVEKCTRPRECVIDPITRNECPYCRYQKCRRVGMRLDLVQEKRGRNKKKEPNPTAHFANLNMQQMIKDAEAAHLFSEQVQSLGDVIAYCNRVEQERLEKEKRATGQ